MDIAEFVHKTADWTSSLTEAWTGRLVLYGALSLLLAWRLGSVVLQTLDRVEKSSPAEQAASYAGDLVILLCVGAVWWLIRRHDGEGVTVERLLDVAKRVALPLIALYMGLQAVGIVVTLLAGLLGLLLLGLGKVEDLGETLELVSRLIEQDANWQTLLAVAAMLAAYFFARRAGGRWPSTSASLGPAPSGYSSRTQGGPWATSAGAGSSPWTSGGS